MASSIGNIQKQIADADVNLQGLVAWLGTNGLESILSQMNDNTRYRGILVFESLSQLAVAGGADSQYAVAPDPNTAGGYNLYVFSPVIDSTIVGAVTSSSAGQWRPVFPKAPVVEGPWKTNVDDAIVPRAAYINKPVGIGTDIPDTTSLWLDIAGIGADGKGRGVRFPSLTTSEINNPLITTLLADMVFYNETDKMLQRYDATEGNTKSAGVYAGSYINSLSVAVFSIDVTIPPQHVDGFKVYCTPTNSFTGTVFASNAWYITKSTSSFTIHFPSGTGTGTIQFDYQISH